MESAVGHPFHFEKTLHSKANPPPWSWEPVWSRRNRRGFADSLATDGQSQTCSCAIWAPSDKKCRKSETFSLGSTLIVCKEISKARDFSHFERPLWRGTFWRQNLKRSARNELLMAQLVTRNYCFSATKRIQVEQAENATLFKKLWPAVLRLSIATGWQRCRVANFVLRLTFKSCEPIQNGRWWLRSWLPLVDKIMASLCSIRGISDCIGFLSSVSCSLRSFSLLGSNVFTLATGQRAPHSKWPAGSLFGG